jgi:hypothetical protein
LPNLVLDGKILGLGQLVFEVKGYGFVVFPLFEIQISRFFQVFGLGRSGWLLCQGGRGANQQQGQANRPAPPGGFTDALGEDGQYFPYSFHDPIIGERYIFSVNKKGQWW